MQLILLYVFFLSCCNEDIIPTDMINYEPYHAAHRPVFSRGHGCIFDLKHLLICFNGVDIDQNSKKLTECFMNQDGGRSELHHACGNSSSVHQWEAHH